MTLTQRPAPHIRHSDSISVAMADVLLALIPCVGMACYYFGLRVALNCAISVVSALVIETVLSVIVRRKLTIGDFSAVVTAVVIAMLLPAAVPVHYIVIANLTALLAAKWMFGGLGKNVFNPALLGAASVAVMTPAAMTAFTPVGVRLSLPNEAVDQIGVSHWVLTDLKAGEPIETSVFNAFVGRQVGLPASVCIPLLIIVALYLAYRRIISLNITLSMLLTVAAIALIAPRTGTALESAGFELVSGSLVFCAIFCANDPVTTPNTAAGQIFFGIFAGVITMLIRYYGSFDEGVVFAVLIVNAMSFALDKIVHRVRLRAKGGAAQWQ